MQNKVDNSNLHELEGALEGLNILDFTWIVAGPTATRMLGAHGATVIKIESTKRLDIFRAYQPMAGGIPGVNRSGVFDAYNHDKLGMALNLSKPAGLEIAKKLVRWADIVIENFAPGTMDRLGLSYDEAKKTKPDIIMASLSLQGQTGPSSKQGGFGTELQALAGYNNLVRWPGEAPQGMQNPYTDFVVPWFAIVAILAAVDYRNRTGKGQYIDISQLEPGVLFLTVPIMDYLLNSREAKPVGNRCDYASPHGVFRCRGDDRWCALAVFNDSQWQALCLVMDNPYWVGEESFRTLLARKRNEDELERLIEQWMVEQDAEKVMSKLQESGVPAGIVAHAQDVYDEPHLRRRGHFKKLNHPEIGEHSYEMPSWRLSLTGDLIHRPSPCLGEHSEYICTKILGMSDDEFVKLASEGVLE